MLANGELASRWDAGIGAFDEAIGYGNCMNDGGAGCPTVDWGWVSNPEKGSVLRASWASNGQHAGVYFQSSTPQDFSTYAKGHLEFDIRTVTGATDLVMKVDCVWPCSSGDQRLTGRVTSEWQRVSVPVSRLVSGGLELAYVDTGLVFWPADRVAVDLEIDNVIGEPPDPVTDTGGEDSDTDLDLERAFRPHLTKELRATPCSGLMNFQGRCSIVATGTTTLATRAGATTSGSTTNVRMRHSLMVIW